MYNALIQQFKAAQATATEAYAAVARAEVDLFPGLEDYERAVKSRSSYKTERELKAFCTDLSELVVRIAQREFAPAGGTITIARDRELEEAGVDIGETLDKGGVPDLDRFSAHLKAKYAGEAGTTLGYQQAAKAIIDGLWLRPDSEMKRTASGIVITAPVGSEASYSTAGRRRISHYTTDRVAALFRGIATFATMAGYLELAAVLRRSWVLRDEYYSRDKLLFEGLEITRFNDKWQFRFAHAVGDALSLFLSEHGAEHLASRAR